MYQIIYLLSTEEQKISTVENVCQIMWPSLFVDALQEVQLFFLWIMKNGEMICWFDGYKVHIKLNTG